jgi:chemotaxis protein CheZ
VAEPEAPDDGPGPSAAHGAIDTLGGELARHQVHLVQEIVALGRTIAELRGAITSLHGDRVAASWFPQVGDELDAVVAHSATATEVILATCEMLDALSLQFERDSRDAEALTRATARIYEACSFQDITGQRITKVITALRAIDRRVADLLHAVARPQEQEKEPPGPSSAGDPDGMPFLSGLHSPHAAMAQAEVDRLLAASA